MDMPIPERYKIVLFTNYRVCKLFENEHYGVRIR